ncbi:MAG: SDR family NAD(P)-dependent oxidoreductase [Aliifodinibius sp.]|nr:SDR family NAD(P)-dependent oxidoreductase [Fodinibius sp.]NIV16322.1 SDR family NAD(P)-dependent oxidoreductase [Fodinibius sp.]NIY30289.1 SDR family NAD(P)-dependent oxidoreductase [Fodinibius sp.]
MRTKAILIGNSDGIGLATTRRLLASGWDIIGVSRSESPITTPHYQHRVVDVSDSNYAVLIDELVRKTPLDLCIYFAGIGELLDPLDMSGEAKIIEVNLTGMVKTASAVIPPMVQKGQGHFIGVSSLADELLSAEAPSYHASKAGFSNYLGSLALALKPRGVYVTNVRFGFVDTKMAQGEVKPFMMSVEKAVDHIETCLRKKPVRYTAPQIAIPLVKFRKLMMRLGAQ